MENELYSPRYQLSDYDSNDNFFDVYRLNIYLSFEAI